VDVVLGGGRHRIASHLHLHPDAEALPVRVEASGGALRREPAPLHEHFGETRTATRLVLEAESALPWIGAFSLRFDGRTAPQLALDFDGTVARLRADSLAAAWTVRARGDAALAFE